MIGRLIERLFVEVRADLTKLASDLRQGVAQSNAATSQMAMSWNKVEREVAKLQRQMQKGKITQAGYTSQMNKLASAMKGVAGSYQQAQKQVWGYAKASQVASQSSFRLFGRGSRQAQTFARSTGMARMQMLNLGYQINDVGMTLATGMNPMTVLIQQGSQMVQIYAGQGGVNAALKDMGRIISAVVRRFWPIAIIAGLFKMLQVEINKTSDVSVTLGDVLKATWQLATEGIHKLLQPAIEKIAPWMQWAWEKAVEWIKWGGNMLINVPRVAVKGIGAIVGTIPNLFKGAFNKAVSHVLTKMHDMVWYIAQAVNGVASQFNEVFGTDLSTNAFGGIIEQLSEASGDYFRAGHEAGEEARATWAAFREEADAILASDPMGEMFKAIRDRSVEIAMQRIQDEMGELGEGAGKVKEEIEEMMKALDEQLTTAADNLAGVFGNAFERLAETGKLTFSSFIQDLNQLIIRSTSELLQQELANMFKVMATARGGLGGFFSNIFTGLFGGGLPGRARGGVEMPWRSFVAGEEGAEVISQDGPSGARRVMTAGETRRATSGAGRSSGPTVIMNISTPDVEGFKRSQAQIAGRMGAFISKSQRNQ